MHIGTPARRSLLGRNQVGLGSVLGLAVVCLTVAACSDDSTADSNGDAGDRAQEPNGPGEPEPAPSNAAEPEPQAPNNSSTAGDVHNAHVAVSASGTAIATWAQSDGSGDRIYTNVWNTSWQGQTRIDTADGASSPHVALNSNGVGLAVWGQRVADELGVWASHWQDGWSSPESLERVAGTVYGPASMLFANGEAVVAFEVFQSVDNDHVYGLSFD